MGEYVGTLDNLVIGLRVTSPMWITGPHLFGWLNSVPGLEKRGLSRLAASGNGMKTQVLIEEEEILTILSLG
jgi:hypothetical protein